MMLLQRARHANPQCTFPYGFSTAEIESLLQVLLMLLEQFKLCYPKSRTCEHVITQIFQDVFDDPLYPPAKLDDWLPLIHATPESLELFKEFASKGRVEGATFGHYILAANSLSTQSAPEPQPLHNTPTLSVVLSDDFVLEYPPISAIPILDDLFPNQSTYAQPLAHEAPLTSLESVPAIETSWDVPYTQNAGYPQQVSYDGMCTVQAPPVQPPPSLGYNPFQHPVSPAPFGGYNCSSPVSDASWPSPGPARQQVLNFGGLPALEPKWGGQDLVPESEWQGVDCSIQRRTEAPYSGRNSDQLLVDMNRGNAEGIMYQQQVVHEFTYTHIPKPHFSIFGASIQAGTSNLPEPSNGIWEAQGFDSDSLYGQQSLNNEFEDVFLENHLSYEGLKGDFQQSEVYPYGVECNLQG